MAVELVTGYAGKAHVSSSEDGARQAGTVGTGMYALETVDEPLKATLENANTVTVGPGDVLMNGRHVQLTGSTTYGIPVGTQGQKTSNLLVIRYEVAEDGTESATAITLTGSPSTAEPEDPTLATGDILAGDSPVDMPLYRVITTGIETAEPVPLFQTIPPIAMLSFADLAGSATSDQLPVVPVSKGGTGATSGAAALESLGIKSWLLSTVFRIGFVWVSYTNTSPASILGGTWTPITGRFPYFNAGTDTGGSNSHTHGLGAGYAQFSDSGYGDGNAAILAGRKSASWSNSNGFLIQWAGGQFNRFQNGNISNQSAGTPLGGSTDSGSNMPAYQTLYAWRRTA